MYEQKQCKISIEPYGRVVFCNQGENLLKALIKAEEIHFMGDCGGKGLCDKCLVGIFNNGKWEDNKSCSTTVSNHITIKLIHNLILLEEPLKISFPSHSYLQKGSYGLAIDIGTTTIELYLCSLSDKNIITTRNILNQQVHLGTDVITRLNAIREDSNNMALLQKMCIKTINREIAAICEAEKIDPKSIENIVVVGNSAMIHIFVGEDPSSMGVYPYKPIFIEEKTLSGKDIGLIFTPDAEVYTLPLISGFIGADIVAAFLAERKEMSDSSLLIDIGTNGEIIIKEPKSRYVTATSCSTGPAFEGATISHGLIAMPGAITGFKFDKNKNKIDLNVIKNPQNGNVKPIGICGTGMVSIIAELLKAGVIMPDGRFNKEASFSHFIDDLDGVEQFVLVYPEQTISKKAITLTQKDVRSIQLAKGAIYTGIQILCREVGVKYPEQLLLAGNMGTNINKKDLEVIKMIPRLQPTVKFRQIGNASGRGAVKTLLDKNIRIIANEIAQSTKVINLSKHPDFQNIFINSLSF